VSRTICDEFIKAAGASLNQIISQAARHPGQIKFIEDIFVKSVKFNLSPGKFVVINKILSDHVAGEENY